MSRWHIRFAAKANREALAHAIYIAKDSPATARRFLTAVRATGNSLKDLPRAGSLCDDWHPQLIGIRRCAIKGFPRHVFFYEVDAHEVRILRVLHGSQDVLAMLLEQLH